MTYRKVFRLAVTALALAAVGMVVGFAQTDSGAIFGTVKDATGGVVPGAEVVVTHVSTNFTRSTTTGDDGTYYVRYLPLGAYSLTVTMPGFKTYTHREISLELGRNARVDAKLEVGEVSQAVEVVGDAPLVETTNATLGRVVGSQEVLNLPIINRRIYSLLSLTPGIEKNDFEAAGTFGFSEQNVTISGSSRAGIGSVNFLVDGGSNVSGLRGSANPAPNPDAIQEFKVTTNSFSSEFGRFQAGVVEIATKSGTNGFHGSVFEFYRDEKFNAFDWSPSRIVGEEKPQLDRHDFGFTLGGPIKKDRTFFFVSYAGLRQKQTNIKDTAVVPTALEREGNYSQSKAKPKDPVTGQLFPDGIIPKSRMDRVALALQQEWVPQPQLNDPGNASSGYRTTYRATQAQPTRADEMFIKIDHLVGDNHRLFTSYFFRPQQFDEGLFGNLPYTVREMTGKQHNLVVGHTWTMGSSTINQLRFNYVWAYGGRDSTPDKSIVDYGSTMAFQGIGDDEKYKSLPYIRIDNFFNLQTAIDGPEAGSTFYQLREAFSTVKGSHSLKLGGELYFETFKHNTSLNNYGHPFRFNGKKTGNAYADFQLGLMDSFKQDSPVEKLNDSWFYGLFLQDDFKLRSGLTLNLGVRWDVQLPMSDPFDRQITYVNGAQSTLVPYIISQGKQVVVPHLLFPGDKLDSTAAHSDGIENPPAVIPRGIVNTDWNNFAPRIGLAWDVRGDGKTAVRFGFGKYYGGISGNEWNGSADNQPFTIRQTFTGDVGTLTNPKYPGGNPFPYNFSPGQIPIVYLPMSVLGPDLTFEWPYTYQANVSVQREVVQDLSASVAYVGTFSRKLPIDIDNNYPQLNVPGIVAKETNYDQRRPLLPGTLGRVRTIFSAVGSDYHALQTMVEKRGRTMSVRANYVFGKGLEDAQVDDESRASIQSQQDVAKLFRAGKTPSEIPALAAERARGGGDRTHRFNASFIWELNYLQNQGRLLRAIANGWTASAIIRMRSGDPFTIGVKESDPNWDGPDGGTHRADVVPGIDPNKPNGASRSQLSRYDLIQKYFETGAFKSLTPGTNGNSGRNILVGPADRNVDMGFFRDFSIREGWKLQLRTEINNVFNIVNLDNPGSTVGDNQFGKISNAADMRELQFGLRFSF